MGMQGGGDDNHSHTSWTVTSCNVDHLKDKKKEDGSRNEFVTRFRIIYVQYKSQKVDIFLLCLSLHRCHFPFFRTINVALCIRRYCTHIRTGHNRRFHVKQEMSSSCLSVTTFEQQLRSLLTKGLIVKTCENKFLMKSRTFLQ